MSWDAWLTDDRGHCDGEGNYTHNVGRMLSVAAGIDASWYRMLNGMTGAEGAEFIDRTIKALEAEPERFEAMNPKNGWGSYDGILTVLRKMRDAVPEWPTTWTACG